MRLLVAALASELQAFPAELPGFDRLVTGPGKLMAAYGLTRALDATRYDEIVVVGTAGAVDDSVESGIYDVSAAIQHDVQDLDGVIGQHVSLPSRVETGRDGVTIATGDIFVDDADADHGEELVLESACQRSSASRGPRGRQSYMHASAVRQGAALRDYVTACCGA